MAGLTISKVTERSEYYNILIFGESGIGKTTLAGSADAVPALRPVLFIDIEGGTTSLTHSYPEVETVRVKTWQDMQNVFNELAEGKHGYKTVVLDSLTEIQKFNMYHVMEKAVLERSNQDPDVPAMRDWGISLEQTRRLVRGFRDLPMNTIFTALVREDTDKRTAITSYKPSLPGKAAGEIAAFLDIVVFYYQKPDPDTGELTRYLLTQKTETHVAKDRSGKLPMTIENPTMATIHKLMTAAQTDAKDASDE